MNNKKRLSMLGMLLLLAVFLVGCNGSPVSQLPKYTLHIKVDPEGAGSVAVTDGAKFSKDAEVILTPTANPGWAFDHWAGFNANQVIAQGNAWKIIMDSDKSLTAVFKQLPTNQSPTVNLIAVPLSGPAPLEVKFTATGHDPDNDPLKYDWTFGDGAIQTDGGATPTHTYQNSGSYVAKVTVKDGKGGTASAEITIQISQGNHNPTAVNDTATLDEDTEINVDVLANDTDADGDSLTISAVSEATNGTVAIQNGLIHYIPKANFNGSSSFTYTVVDGKGGQATASVTVTVNPVNDAPIAVNDTAKVDQDGSVLIDVLPNDTDVDGDTLSLVSFGLASSGTVTKEDNSLRYTPKAGYYGEDQFTYQISDGKGGTAQATVNVTVNRVNHTPVAVNDAAEVEEDSNVLIQVLANDTDADGDTLTVQSFTQGGHGEVMQEGNSLRYTPAANFNGSDSFTYTVSDGFGGTISATVTVTVKPVNDLPVAQNDTVQVDEDNNVLIAVLANDTDVEGDTLTLQSFTQGSQGTVTQEGNSLRYTPVANYHGTDSFTYQINDGNGGIATATVNLTINSINDLPVANNDTATVDGGSSVLINILQNDSDADGDTLTIDSYTQGSHGTVVAEGTSLRYKADSNYHGADSFTYQISDGHGGVATATVNLTVQFVNHAPTTVNDAATIDEDGTVLLDVLANDLDSDGDALTISDFTQGSHGTVTKEGSSLRYTPVANYFGSDSYTYQISDGNGGTASGKVTVTINPVNDDPTANADNATLDEDADVLLNILANDSDVDGDILTVSDFTQGVHGTVTKEGNSLRYTPAANYNGADSFTYTVTDGKGGVAVATVNVTVNSVNDVPVAVNDSPTVDEDGNILIDVAYNDTDADGDFLTVNNFTQGAHGTVVKAGNSLRYTPVANYYGSDSFTYQITDGHGGTATATVNVTVNSVNDAPIANTDFAEVNQDETILIDVVPNDTDIEGDALVISSVTQGSHGMVSKEGNSIRYTPDAGYNGPDSFTYTINDGHGGTSTALVNVTVKPTGPIVLVSMDIDSGSYMTGKIPFTVTQAGNYMLKTSYYKADCDTVLYLSDASETLIAVNDDYTDLYSCIIMWLEPGNYYVSVEEISTNPLFCHLEVSSI